MVDPKSGNISDNSRRIAKNTLLLYFRMLLLLFIGLFTSRIVLKTLGVEDYGVYNAVGGVVTVLTYRFALTDGERAFAMQKLRRFIPWKV